MDLAFVLALLMQTVQENAELDAAMLEHLKQRELFLQEKMAQLLLETEQQKLEQSKMDMQALLFTALQEKETSKIHQTFSGHPQKQGGEGGERGRRLQ